ncbi:hypothetical protein [Alloalcanivorax xenomutans]|uniref:hypothetical protein n=1 Tax=Alloalcanivorax xenomutans TaxID=1094342 RepID=UPI001F183D9D|nr:hypothetical protein [Alloalcanivorax xenomutans]MCE7521966.1 hypothetical protein [Alloalcanivorax xenomutans]
MILDDITLENMVWTNEFGEPSVAQEMTRSVTGNPILHEQAQPLGRPMRLTGAWVSRQVGQALCAKEAAAGMTWPITLDDGRTYTVAFDRRNGAAVELIPVGECTEYSPEHPYELTLNFIVLAEG